MRSLIKTVADLARTAQGQTILAALRALPEHVMFKNPNDHVWHASDRCPVLTQPFEPVRFDLHSMQLMERPCTSCGSHRSLALGQALTVCGDALDVFEEPLDWPGVSARRRFSLDPLRSFPVRLTPSAASWASILDLIDPWIAAEMALADTAAAALDPTPVIRALCASSLIDPNDTRPPNSRWLSPTELAASHIRRDGSRRVRTDLHRQLDLCMANSPRRYLVVSAHLYEFAAGNHVERAVDLLTVHSRIGSTSATVLLPPVAALVIKENHSVAITELLATDDLDVIRWAVEMFHAAPDRSLAAALAAARRLLCHRQNRSNSARVAD